MPIDLPFERGATPPGPVLPPLSLLDPREESFPLTQPGLERMARRLEEKFCQLGIDGGVVRIVPGPVVMTFEFCPAVDVKAFKFPGLADELSLELQAESVRIERRHRDSLMAVALPNPTRRSISLRELLEASAAYPADAALTIPLGTSATGEPFAIDLARVSHLLLAGSNGASASAALAAMIASLVCRATPEKLRFILPRRPRRGEPACPGGHALPATLCRGAHPPARPAGIGRRTRSAGRVLVPAGPAGLRRDDRRGTRNRAVTSPAPKWR